MRLMLSVIFGLLSAAKPIDCRVEKGSLLSAHVPPHHQQYTCRAIPQQTTTPSPATPTTWAGY